MNGATSTYWRGKRCLITGASSGLGQAVAIALGRHGAKLILTGRNARRLEETANQLADLGHPAADRICIAADLTSPDDRKRLFAAVAEEFGGLDVLINSAGVGAYGHYETHDDVLLRQLMEINFFALAEMCRSALPYLKCGADPVVVNLGSIVARRALPARPEYSASKFAVTGLTEALRAEWVRYGIHVVLVNPGFTKTAFENNLLADTAVYKTQDWRCMSPENVAVAVLKAARSRQAEVTLTARGKLLLFMNRLFPSIVNYGMARFTRKLYPKVNVNVQANAAP